MISKTAKIALLTILFVSAFSLRARPDQDAPPLFDKTETMIAMRDGTHLHTSVFAPKNQSGPLPIIFLRTPYGIPDSPRPLAGSYLKELAAEGYIFAYQDIRGRYKSEGKFVMNRPPRDHGDSKSVDESSDTYDSIDWLVRNVPNNNGRVGMLGISYDGWLTAMSLLESHPALKAISPQASPADMFLGDDFHHNGAFRLSYGFEYVAMMETSNVNFQFKFDEYDTYEWYLSLGALSHANERYFQGRMPTWNDFVSHPNYDGFWQRQAVARIMTRIGVRTLSVAGWWDQEDFYGPVTIYDALEKVDKQRMNYLVVGPWNHGGWARAEGDKLGKIEFGAPTSRYFREKIQAPWFAHFLKDKGSLAQPEAVTFQTGANKWESYDSWPPHEGFTEKSLYFGDHGRLSFEAPAKGSDAGFDSYISDPAHPVPYRPRPIEPTYYPRGSGWYTWLVEDQRFAHLRPDVLSWETDSLNNDVVVSGAVTAKLFASTSGSDSDWIVKLIDVYPEEYEKDPKMGGYQLMVANEVFRGRFRKSFEKPEAVRPNEVNEYNIGLHTINHRFLKGHRIMVQVQSTWFPIIDRNPQKFVDNIFNALDSDYQAAEQRIFRSPARASRIIVSTSSRP
jgi:uncharacterized protein